MSDGAVGNLSGTHATGPHELSSGGASATLRPPAGIEPPRRAQAWQPAMDRRSQIVPASVGAEGSSHCLGTRGGAARRPYPGRCGGRAESPGPAPNPDRRSGRRLVRFRCGDCNSPSLGVLAPFAEQGRFFPRLLRFLGPSRVTIRFQGAVRSHDRQGLPENGGRCDAPQGRCRAETWVRARPSDGWCARADGVGLRLGGETL